MNRVLTLCVSIVMCAALTFGVPGCAGEGPPRADQNTLAQAQIVLQDIRDAVQAEMNRLSQRIEQIEAADSQGEATQAQLDELARLRQKLEEKDDQAAEAQGRIALLERAIQGDAAAAAELGIVLAQDTGNDDLASEILGYGGGSVAAIIGIGFALFQRWRRKEDAKDAIERITHVESAVLASAPTEEISRIATISRRSIARGAPGNIPEA